MKGRVVCCGNIAFDLILTKKTAKGELSFDARPGGSVFNTSIMLARLGLPVSLLAKNGADFLGNILLDVMHREKISTRHILREKEVKTGLAFAQLDKKKNSSYLFYRAEGSRAAFTQAALSPSLFRGASVFHAGSAFAYADHTFDNALKLMLRAKREGLFTSYDPNWRSTRIQNKKIARMRIKQLFSLADLLKLSENDALSITGKRSLSAALKSLPSSCVVTLGEKGSLYWDGKKKLVCPPFKARIADTIGAGDAFTSGLIYKYCLQGKEAFYEKMSESLRFASAISALVCSGRGATGGLKNVRQVNSFLRKHR